MSLISRRLLATVAALSLALPLAACNDAKETKKDTQSTTSQSTSEKPEKKVDPAEVVTQQVRDAYKAVLQDPLKYRSGGGSSNRLSFHYYLVDLAQSGVPQLILSVPDDSGMDELRILVFNPKTKQAEPIGEPFNVGAAETGGARGSLELNQNETALLYTTTMGGTGETDVTRYLVSGNKLEQKSLWSGRFDQMPAEYREGKQVNWFGIEDTNPVDSIQISQDVAEKILAEQGDATATDGKQNQPTGSQGSEPKKLTK